MKTGKIGSANSTISYVSELLNNMTRLFYKNPENYICDQISCIWCRETERKLNLYDKIKPQQYFHKYYIFRILLKIINKMRLNMYKFARVNKYKNNNLYNIRELSILIYLNFYYYYYKLIHKNDLNKRKKWGNLFFSISYE